MAVTRGSFSALIKSLANTFEGYGKPPKRKRYKAIRRGHHSMMEVSAGTRSVLYRYLAELHDTRTTKYYDARQALIRRLLRLEGKLPQTNQGRKRK